MVPRRGSKASLSLGSLHVVVCSLGILYRWAVLVQGSTLSNCIICGAVASTS